MLFRPDFFPFVNYVMLTWEKIPGFPRFSILQATKNWVGPGNEAKTSLGTSNHLANSTKPVICHIQIPKESLLQIIKLGSFRRSQFSSALETEEETWNQLKFIQAMLFLFDSAEPKSYEQK